MICLPAPELSIEELRQCLNPNLDQKRRSRFELAFCSLENNDNYCRYHYEEYCKQYELFLAAMRGQLNGEELENPQYYRLAYEAHCFSFFRAFHALIESIPYLVNLLMEANDDPESRQINWQTIIKPNKDSDGAKQAEVMRNSTSYRELEHIVNVSKHRRIARIDCRVLSVENSPHFCPDDFDIQLRCYEIKKLMVTIYNDLHPKALGMIKVFCVNGTDIPAA